MQILDCDQGSPEWFEARAGLPTASQFHRFVTAARGDYSKQAQGYIADLLVEIVQGPSEAQSTYYMDRGSLLEDEARSWYEFEKDVDVSVPGLVINKGAGWSPDGFDVKWLAGLEIKCPKPSTHVKWLLDGKLPPEHKAQCHGALLIGELGWLDFVSYCPGFEPLVVRVEPDHYTECVDACLEQFLEDLNDAKSQIIHRDT